MLNVRVAVVGPGAIGSAFLRQLAEGMQTGLGATLKASIKLVAVANSKTMVACSGDDLLMGWTEQLQLVRNLSHKPRVLLCCLRKINFTDDFTGTKTYTRPLHTA